MRRFPLGSRVGYKIPWGMGDWGYGVGKLAACEWDKALVSHDNGLKQYVAYSNLMSVERALAADAAQRLSGNRGEVLDTGTIRAAVSALREGTS